jgi:glycosyltransferase involved in cell wall biosynthesis
MIHDLIPIEHPEFCSPRAAGLHRRRIDGVLDHATLIIANSAATAADVARYAASAGKPAPPTCVAPLGLEPAFLEPRLPPVLGAPYFVCVGTIEPRKNIAFILRVWRRLAERMGDRTPALVLVGQRGWENEWIMDHLERSPPVLRFVHEASGLNDDRLAALIGGACALLAPSLSEGFDLPVSEALVLGTPVIASDIPVHRELAAATQLIDPLDGPAWIEAITRATVERRPCAPTAGPGWKDHFDTVAEALGWARRASGEGGKAARVPAADARRA